MSFSIVVIVTMGVLFLGALFNFYFKPILSIRQRDVSVFWLLGAFCLVMNVGLWYYNLIEVYDGIALSGHLEVEVVADRIREAIVYALILGVLFVAIIIGGILTNKRYKKFK